MEVFLVYFEYNDIFKLDNVYATEELAKIKVSELKLKEGFYADGWVYEGFEVIGSKT